MKPNVLWIMTDEQRVDSLGCYGSAWAHTPHIDALARSGVLFRNAYVQCPQCVPSRNSILCCRYPQELGCTFNQEGIRFPVDTTSLVDVLNLAGYDTVSFGKQHTSNPIAWHHQRDWILNEAYAGYFKLNKRFNPADFDVLNRPSQDEPLILAGRYPGGDDHPSRNITDWAIQYLRERRASTPFFLRVSHNYPHTPVLPSPPWDTLYNPDDLPIRPVDRAARATRSRWDRANAAPQNMELLTGAEFQRAWQHYMGLCAQVDHEVGRIIEELDCQGLRKDTIVIFSSDHGACLGQFGVATKGTFDDPSWHVPFVWSWPGELPGGKVCDDLCEHLDMGVTLAGLLDIKAVPPNWRGRHLFDSPRPQAIFGQIGYPNMNSRTGRASTETRNHFHELRVGCRTDRYRLDYSIMRDGVKCPVEDGNLFDLGADAEELNNRWDDPDYNHICQGMIQELDRWFESLERPPALFDDMP